jgi:putative membrane protein
MRGLIVRWGVNAGGLLQVSALFDGGRVAGVGWASVAALFLGVFNALIRPVVLVLTLPLNVVTLGLFTFIINGFMLWLTGKLLAGFSVEGFWAAVGGALVLSLISLGVSSMVGERGQVEIIEMRRNRQGDWEER